MTVRDLKEILRDFEDNAQIWIQTKEQHKKGLMSPVVEIKELGDEFQQPDANEGDLVIRLDKTI